MKRRLFNVLTALSLLLFVAIGPLWFRSYWVSEEICYRHQNQGVLGLASYYGLIGVGYSSNPPSSYAAGFGYHTGIPATRMGRWLAYDHVSDTAGWLVRFRYWLPMLAAAVLPAAWLVREWKRRRQLKQGCCPKCGYDLRASKDRCPECGTPIPAQSQGVQN